MESTVTIEPVAYETIQRYNGICKSGGEIRKFDLVIINDKSDIVWLGGWELYKDMDEAVINKWEEQILKQWYK